MALDPLILPRLPHHPGPCSDYEEGDVVKRKDAMNYNVFGMRMYYRIELKGARGTLSLSLGYIGHITC